MRARVLLVAILGAVVVAGTATATIRPVRATDAALLHRAPTREEQLASSIARRLTGKQVKIRCGPLGVRGAGWPRGIDGITLFTHNEPAGYAILLPQVCAQLVAFRADPEAWSPDACTDQANCLKVAEAAFALATVTHESYHLLGYRNEAQVECYGMQSIWYAARRLGAPLAEAQSIARFYADELYPQRRHSTPAYWSAQCRDGGKYDLRPKSHAWPS